MKQIIDTSELVERFNEDEAVWQTYVARRTARRLLGEGNLPAAILDDLDWAEAERECRRTNCVGRRMPLLQAPADPPVTRKRRIGFITDDE